MGFLDFFSRNPTAKGFAQLFIREMRRSGITEKLLYDEPNARIIRGVGPDAASIHLGNFYQEHLTLPRGQRQAHLARCIRAMHAPDTLPEDFETARGNLRPKIWARASLEKSRLQVQLDGGDPGKFDIPEYEIGSHLIASLVYDFPDSMRTISHEDLQTWGVTYYEALEIARENLAATPCAVAEIGDGTYCFATGDNYDSCRLLVPDILERCEVAGNLVAVIPNRDMLLVTGTDDEEGLTVVQKLATSGNEQPRPLVALPIRLDGDAWIDWFPERRHPAFNGFQELALQYLQQEYGEQQELLNRLHQQNGTDIFVATFAVVQKDDGKLLTQSAWTQGIEILLPRTEWITFVAPADGKYTPVAIASWERAEQIVGRLMMPTNHYPPRVHVTGFPTVDELAELGMTML